ncbi:MAG: hypothetical protein GC191_09325 [Azospirillum sp.]|nr:hypothetical protein [Azospirillum sp.]
MMIRLCIPLGVAALLLSGCASPDPSPASSVLPPLQEYGDEFRGRLGAELQGLQDGGATKQFVRDCIATRDAIRASADALGR